MEAMIKAGAPWVTSLVSKAKALSLGVSELELKVLEATNEDPWGPHGSVMTGALIFFALMVLVVVGHDDVGLPNSFRLITGWLCSCLEGRSLTGHVFTCRAISHAYM